MGLPLRLTQRLKNLLFGTPFGSVYGGKQQPPPTLAAAVDGRTFALRMLRDYLTGVVFYLPGKEPAIDHGFSVLAENFLLEIPDAVHDQKYPSIAVLPGNWEYLPVGFVPRVVPSTWNLFGPGTAVQKHAAEYSEDLKVELWASKEPELRSMRAGIELAMNPVEGMAGVRFYMDQYFGQPVVFTMMRGEATPNEMAARGRRSATFVVNVRFELCSLVNVVSFKPETTVLVDGDKNGDLVNVWPGAPPSQQGNPGYPVQPPPGTEYVIPDDAEDARAYQRERERNGGCPPQS